MGKYYALRSTRTKVATATIVSVWNIDEWIFSRCNINTYICYTHEFTDMTCKKTATSEKQAPKEKLDLIALKPTTADLKKTW